MQEVPTNPTPLLERLGFTPAEIEEIYAVIRVEDQRGIVSDRIIALGLSGQMVDPELQAAYQALTGIYDDPAQGRLTAPKFAADYEVHTSEATAELSEGLLTRTSRIAMDALGLDRLKVEHCLAEALRGPRHDPSQPDLLATQVITQHLANRLGSLCMWSKDTREITEYAQQLASCALSRHLLDHLGKHHEYTKMLALMGGDHGQWEHTLFTAARQLQEPGTDTTTIPKDPTQEDMAHIVRARQCTGALTVFLESGVGVGLTDMAMLWADRAMMQENARTAEKRLHASQAQLVRAACEIVKLGEAVQGLSDTLQETQEALNLARRENALHAEAKLHPRFRGHSGWNEHLRPPSDSNREGPEPHRL